MISIYRYQKHIDQIRTVTINLPEQGGEHENVGVELATIEDFTYVSIPDEFPLPPQPPEIEVELVELTQELCQAIKKHSPHVQLINERVGERIRLEYSEGDELKLSRLGWSVASGLTEPSASVMRELVEYNEYVEAQTTWGNEQKELLGLCPPHLDEGEASPYVPQKVSRAQAMYVMISQGIWSQAVAFVEAIEDPVEKELAEVALYHTQEYARDSPFLALAGDALGLTEEDIDNLFIAANQIKL